MCIYKRLSEFLNNLLVHGPVARQADRIRRRQIGKAMQGHAEYPERKREKNK